MAAAADLYRDPLSETTRRERRTILTVSFAALVMVDTGNVPTQFVTLGLTFTSADQARILLYFAAAIGYLLVTFLVYALGDFFTVRATYVSVRASYVQTVTEATRLIPVLGKFPLRLRLPFYLLFFVRLLLLDIALPITLAIAAIYALTHRHLPYSPFLPPPPPTPVG
jgi:hypothetical protein